jgi:protein-tyrosine phosphatase
VLYRSGTTHAITAADVERLATCGIRHSYDLRSNAERQDYPSTLSRAQDINYRFVDHDAIPGDITRMLRKPDAGPDHSKSMMMALYRRLPFDFRKAYRTLFEYLENGDLPLVFNCTAGKDRTGVAAALILTAVGVSHEVIIEDYLLSQRCFDRSCEIILEGGFAASFTGVDREIWEPVMRADADYLDAMFDEVNRSYGSVDGYLSQELNLLESARDRIRSNLLA